MSAAYFYHLTREPLERALPKLITSAARAGWRTVVRGPDAARLAWLDEALWTDTDESFLPHGLAGGPHDQDQPVLLTTGTATPNAADCLMAIDGMAVTAGDVAAFQRTCILFDGNDIDALNAARAQWKALTAEQVPAQYWSQETGKWEKKAESA